LPKIRRGNFIFHTYVGDHGPRHVHVYKKKGMVVKWDLENWGPMKGKASRRLLKHIRDLIDEGRL